MGGEHPRGESRAALRWGRLGLLRSTALVIGTFSRTYATGSPPRAERIAQLAPYPVTMELLTTSGNPPVKFVHSIVFGRAEKRLPPIAAVMVTTLGS